MGDTSTASGLEHLRWLADDPRPLDWNGPTDRPFTRFQDDDLDRTIIEHLEQVARRQPGQVAIADSETALTYGELWAGLSGLAETIAAQTGPGDMIGILLPTSPLFPVAMLACLAAGRPFVPIDTHYPSDWVARVLEDARPALIIGGEDVLEGVWIGPPTPLIIHLTCLSGPATEGWRPATPDVDQPACVLFTSGSTGRPKGVVNSQRGLLQRVAQSINAGHINAEDRFLTLASLSTIVGVRDVVTALLAGGGVRLLDPQNVGARKILNVIRSDAITILFAFPALLRSVVAHDEAQAGDALRLVRVGGDTLLWSDVDLLRAWLAPGAAVQLIYAATEAPMMQWFVDDAFRGDDPRVPIGYALAGNRLAVVEEAGRAAPPGEVGELVVAGPFVMLGLWSDGQVLSDGIALGEADTGRLFHTGDLVRQRPDGLLERFGRRDRQVKIRGARVELDGVEAALRQHPFVRDVGALARTTSGDGAATLVAYVSARDGAPVGLLDELRLLMRSEPPQMRPGRLYFVEAIPRLPSSKLDVRTLQAMDEANARGERADSAISAGEGPAGGDAVARAVSLIWRDVLQVPLSEPEDDFFEVGGDSLKAIAFMIELEKALGLELSLTLINEAPTFAGVCQAVREHRTAGYVPLVLLKAGEGPSPVFFIHGVGGTVAELFPIARRMTYRGAVIGVQARGLNRQEPPHQSVQAMASEYLAAIKTRQPAGPYYLCGYSFGGLIAFEIACRLVESREKVGLVGLFDTVTNATGWPPSIWFAYVCRRAARVGAAVMGAPVSTWPRAVRQACKQVIHGLRFHRADGPAAPPFLRSAPANVLKVAASALIASAHYRPGYYSGELTLFTPVGRDPALPSPQAIWRGHARGLTIIDTAGGHLSMLSASNAESAAASLTRCLPEC